MSTYGQLDFKPQGDQYRALTAYNLADTAPLVIQDSELSPLQKTLALSMMANASDNSGLFTTKDLVKAGIGAGLGAGAALVTGKVMGAVFGVSQEKQDILTSAGALGGLLKATGFWK